MSFWRAHLSFFLFFSVFSGASASETGADNGRMLDLIQAGNAATKQMLNAEKCPSTLKASQATPSKNQPIEKSSTSEGSRDFGAMLMKSCRIGSRGFGQKKHPILGTMRMHWGQDIPAPSGTPVYAPADGQVLSQRTAGGYGKQVVMKLSNGYTIELNHLSRFGKNGKVQRGQIIAYVGSTGLSTGPHLHLGVRNRSGKFIDPKRLFRPAEMCSK